MSTINKLPNETGKLHFAWVGMETDLIFNKGIDLPGFASYPLLENPETRQMLVDYAQNQIHLAQEFGVAVILETATWVANKDRAAEFGFTPDDLGRLNRAAVDVLNEAKNASGYQDILISANIGPRGDGYAPADFMTADEAQKYHSEQINNLAGADLDLVSPYTMTNTPEAIGAARAATSAGRKTVVAFTVELDGTLPTGQLLDDAIRETDDATDAAAAYFMVNCAHPDHFSKTLTGNPRIGGVVVNASRLSHAELDEASELDDGDPDELGRLVTQMAEAHPNINVVGGCCGTDLRHIRSMLSYLKGTT